MKKSKAPKQSQQVVEPQLPQEEVKPLSLSPEYIWVKNANKENLGGLSKSKVLDIFNEELKKEVVANTVIRQVLKQNGLDWEPNLVNRIKKRIEQDWEHLFKKE